MIEDSCKEVYFGEYCKTCQFEKDDESNTSSPCYDCLNEPVNLYSHKPTGWKEKE